jgi:hypothetical protein
MGLESKMFDCQTLVLLAFTRLELGDRKGLQRCHDDFLRLIEKFPDNTRQSRLAEVVVVLNLIQQSQFAQCVQTVRALGTTVKNSEFDFESASNLLALLSHLATKAIQLDDVDTIVENLGLRFCHNRSLTELLAASAQLHPPYADRIRACQAKVLEFAEVAMALSMGGNPTAAVKNLILHGQDTLNARLIDNAYHVLQKHAAKIEGMQALEAEVLVLRTKNGSTSGKASLGEQKRQAGGLVLRTGTRQQAPTVATN